MPGIRGFCKSAICAAFSNQSGQRWCMFLTGLGLAALTVISVVNPGILGISSDTAGGWSNAFGVGSATAFTGWGAMKIHDRVRQCNENRATGGTTGVYIFKDVLAAGLLIAAVCLFMACRPADLATLSLSNLNSGMLTILLSGSFVLGGLFLNLLGTRTNKNSVITTGPEEKELLLRYRARQHNRGFSYFGGDTSFSEVTHDQGNSGPRPNQYSRTEPEQTERNTSQQSDGGRTPSVSNTPSEMTSPLKNGGNNPQNPENNDEKSESTERDASTLTPEMASPLDGPKNTTHPLCGGQTTTKSTASNGSTQPKKIGTDSCGSIDSRNASGSTNSRPAVKSTPQILNLRNTVSNSPVTLMDELIATFDDSSDHNKTGKSDKNGVNGGVTVGTDGNEDGLNRRRLAERLNKMIAL